MGAWTCLFWSVLKDTPPTWKRGNRIANMTIVIMSTNQISYVTKPGPKCFSIWRKKILILGLKKMAYMWHYFSFSQKVGCYSKEDQHTQSNISVVSPKGSSWSYCNKCTTCSIHAIQKQVRAFEECTSGPNSFFSCDPRICTILLFTW